jgi:OFA family oxalate/formate antiporter-like MFS transporter
MNKIRFLNKSNIFYGYWILAVMFFCLFVTSGCGYYIFSLFVLPLQEAFGWSRSEIMIALTIFFLVTGGASPYAGKLVYRYGARVVIAIGAAIGGLGFIILYQMQTLWQFYAGYVVIAIGLAVMGTIPATMVVSNWFVRRRGTAIGIISTGIGAGGLVLSPLVGGYLIPNFGLGTSYIIMAIITWVTIPLVLLIVRTKPEEMGLHPDGIVIVEELHNNEMPLTSAAGLNFKAAIATSTFWLIAVSFIFNGFSLDGVLQSQAPHLQDIGYSSATAATVLGMTGLGSTFGKFFFGWLCDRIAAKYAWSIAQSLQVISIIIFINITPTSPSAALWAYAILMGLGLGGWLPTMSVLTSANFGLVSYGIIFGVVNLIHSTGSSIGPLFAGYIHDTTLSYNLAFTIFLALFAVSISTALAIRRPKALSMIKDSKGETAH